MTDALVKATKCLGNHPKGYCKGKGGRKRSDSAAVNRGGAIQITARQVPHEENSGLRGSLSAITMEDRWCDAMIRKLAQHNFTWPKRSAVGALSTCLGLSDSINGPYLRKHTMLESHVGELLTKLPLLKNHRFSSIQVNLDPAEVKWHRDSNNMGPSICMATIFQPAGGHNGI